jgi:hypothetical protein
MNVVEDVIDDLANAAGEPQNYRAYREMSSLPPSWVEASAA